MVLAYWIVAGLTALVFLAAGSLKLVRPVSALAASGMGWTAQFSPWQVKAIAALEVLGAVGLVLPIATGIAPVLSPLAGAGLAIIMMGAVAVHARRGERSNVVTASVLALLAVASTWLGVEVVLG